MTTLSINDPLRSPAKVDENSRAVQILRKSKFFSSSLDGKTNIDAHKKHARDNHISFDDYVKMMRDAETSPASYRVEASMYGDNSLTAWLKYQQTYVIKKTLIEDCQEELYNPVALEDVKLPFPAVFVIMEFANTPENEGHSASYMIFQRGERFDVTAFVDGQDFYFPLTNETVSNLGEGKMDRYNRDDFTEYFMVLAWYTILFLSVYRKNPKIISVRKIRRGGVLPKHRIASEWHVLNERAITQLIPGSGAPLAGAKNLDGLIPPDERKTELVPEPSTHKSPEEHWVRQHTRTYWTGPGRKIPVLRLITPFKRGVPSETGEIPGVSRECKFEPEDKITST